jgi:hypothetical protein
VNIALSNQSVLSGVILVLFWYYYDVVLTYIIVYLPFLANYLCSAYYFISGILHGKNTIYLTYNICFNPFNLRLDREEEAYAQVCFQAIMITFIF